jgi:hypothetical protein
MTHVQTHTVDTDRYAKCIEVSKRIRWDIEKDIIRGRRFDFVKKFLPDGLSKVQDLHFLSDEERRFLGQIQGRKLSASPHGCIQAHQRK